MEKTNSRSDLTQEEWEKFQEVPDESFIGSASNINGQNQSADYGNISKSEEVKLLDQLSANKPKFSKWCSTDYILVRLPDSKCTKIKHKEVKVKYVFPEAELTPKKPAEPVFA